MPPSQYRKSHFFLKARIALLPLSLHSLHFLAHFRPKNARWMGKHAQIPRFLGNTAKSSPILKGK